MMKKSVLIVEDEMKLANILIEYLQKNDFQTKHIASGSKVIPWVKENKPHHHTTSDDYQEIFDHERSHKGDKK